MDLTSNLIAQSQPATQYRFDAEALDRAILRAEARRARRRAVVARLAAGVGRGPGTLHASLKMAFSRRPA